MKYLIKVLEASVVILITSVVLFIGIGLNTSTAKADSVFRVPSSFLDENKKEWARLEEDISSSWSKNIVLLWQGEGGSVLIGAEFIQTIRQAQQEGKMITLNLIGPAVSMHAFVGCYADRIIYQDGASLNFHAIKAGDGYITAADAAFWNEEMSWYARCKDKGLLSTQNIVDIMVNHKMVTIYPGQNITHEDN